MFHLHIATGRFLGMGMLIGGDGSKMVAEAEEKIENA